MTPSSPCLAAVSGDLAATELSAEPIAAAPAAPSTIHRSRPAARLPLILSLAAVYLVWSSTYLAMRIAVAGLPPMLMGGVRFVIAGGILLAYLVARGAPLPTRREWLYALPVGGLFFVGGNGLVAIAEQSIGSGIAAVVCATMPLWLALFGVAAGDRPGRREWLGLGLGFVGVVVLSSGG